MFTIKNWLKWNSSNLIKQQESDRDKRKHKTRKENEDRWRGGFVHEKNV